LSDWLLTPIGSKREQKRKRVTGTRQGAKIGALVGLVQGILNTSVGLVALYVMQPRLIALIVQVEGSRALAVFPTLWNLMLIVLIIGVPIVSILMGAAVGYLFVVFQHRIPGRSIIRKSLTVSLIFVAVSLLWNLRNLLDPRRMALMQAFWGTSVLLQYGFVYPLIEAPALGYLFGYLLQRKIRAK
jgi:CBS domain containing-hemolysin-like protein